MENQRMGIREFLRTLVPDFCWCTAKDLFLMYEQIYEDCGEGCFRSSLHAAKKDGEIIMKRGPRLARPNAGNNAPMLYMRIKHGK